MKKLFYTLKQEPTVFLFSKAWQHAGNNKPYFLSYLLLTAIGNTLLLLEPLIFAELLNELQTNGLTSDNIQYVGFIIGSMLGILLLFWSCHGPSRTLELRNAFWVKKNYQMYLLNKTFALDVSWHSDRDSGNTIDRINTASEKLFAFSRNSYRVIEILVKAIGTVIVLLFFNVWISVFVFFVTIISLYILYRFDVQLVHQYRKMNELKNISSGKIYDALSNIVTIIVLKISKPALEGIDSALLKPQQAWWFTSWFGESKWFTGNILFRLMVIIPLGFYIYTLYKNQSVLEIGTISALYLYLSNYSRVFFGFSSLYGDLIEQKTGIENVSHIEEIALSENLQEECSMKKSLQLQSVSFSYHDTEKDVSLNIPHVELIRGERIALIGQSGSGKTTFLKVLHGLYNTALGDITVDGNHQDKQFHELDLGTILIPQEPELFSSTVTENITFGLDYTEQQIRLATDLAQFTSTAEKLPNGFKSKINEKGVNLSGGQKQRLALARALLFAEDKDIILLDESTSSVDPETEVQIYKNIFEAFPDKTFLASIHKMNLLKYFDRIIMFDNGTITDEGTFAELVKRNGKFKTMWESFVKTNG